MTAQASGRKVSTEHPGTLTCMWVVARGALPGPARQVRKWSRRGLDNRISMAIRTEGVSRFYGGKRIVRTSNMAVLTSATGEGLVYPFAEETLS